MLVLGLLTCVVLSAFSAQAEVVNTFHLCGEYFYKATEPGGMDNNWTTKKICQMYGQGRLMHSYYATLYSTQHRIPLYSAYVFDPKCKIKSKRINVWHVEPQIQVIPGCKNRNMVLESNLRNLRLDKDVIKGSQAVSSDYSFSGYDRGHLNPSSFSCKDGRTATFTLTNAAPMDPCFNRIHWREWEGKFRKYLLNKLSRDGGLATAYIVTGTVPDATLRIPQRENPEDSERVTVPSHIWTAVCYKHHTDDNKSFSFGYMAENQPDKPGKNTMSVSVLDYQLSRLYRELSGTQQPVKIFVDGCFYYNNNLTMLVEEEKLNPLHTTVQFMEGVRKRKRQNLTFDSMNIFYTMAESLKVYAEAEIACLITHVKPLVREIVVRKRVKRSEGPDAVECLMVPEKQKTAADGSQCSSVSESRDSCECTSGGKTKRCCSSPCLYQHHLQSYWCNSGQTLIKCSPRYSLITAKGERCLDDHTCATYGKDYYWCYKVSGGWDYCSPPLWSSKAKNGKFCRSNRACAKYGSSHMWCFTIDEDNYEECCTSDDCYSAVEGQTCRSNHKCGYYNKSYLWCYTDYEGHWDYCCKNCA